MNLRTLTAATLAAGAALALAACQPAETEAEANAETAAAEADMAADGAGGQSPRRASHFRGPITAASRVREISLASELTFALSPACGDS